MVVGGGEEAIGPSGVSQPLARRPCRPRLPTASHADPERISILHASARHCCFAVGLPCACKSPRILELLRHPGVRPVFCLALGDCFRIESRSFKVVSCRTCSLGSQITAAAFKPCLRLGVLPSTLFLPPSTSQTTCMFRVLAADAIGFGRQTCLGPGRAPQLSPPQSGARNGGNEIIRDPDREAGRASKKARERATERIVLRELSCNTVPCYPGRTSPTTAPPAQLNLSLKA
jgi:hypothetical protein